MVFYKLAIEEIIEVGDGTKAFVFERPDDFTWEEGAHIHVGLEGFDAGETNDKTLVRHMSISSLPEENKVVFTTRVPGSGSLFKTELNKLQKGDTIALFKCGSRMQLRRENRPLVLVSMGVGIVTMRPVILKYAEDSQGIPSMNSLNINGSEDFVYGQELRLLDADRYLAEFTTDRDFFYSRLLDLTTLENAYYYLVGSDGFLMECIAFLKDKGIDKAQILLDKKEEKQIPFFQTYTEL